MLREARSYESRPAPGSKEEKDIAAAVNDDEDHSLNGG